MRQKIVHKAIRLWEKILIKARRVTFPGFDGIPIYNVWIFFWRSIVDGAITTRASAIAFSFFMALFPAIIFLFTLIPYIPIKNFHNELFILIHNLVPGSVFEAIEDTVQDIITRPRGDLLSIGFFMALIFSTNGLASMMSAFDASLHSFERRTWLGQRFIAIVLMIIISLLLTITIGLLTGGQYLINIAVKEGLLKDDFTYFLLLSGKWIVIVALLFFGNSFLYYLAPAKKTKWRFISAGSTLATILSVLAIFGFTYYINNFGQYNKLYGSIGTLLVVLFLLYILSVILLIGFELNASINEAHRKARGI
ncbi:MAG: hypothetical protein A2W90_11525 [Bacteroidetes bacterium GWF2_42_66]|nr:MAG: hypothetical protein A2W92_13530 [Bacteroidetes bacterium GWA2_42_15]OFY01795.1 MAG: hypothetical protein A2W89_23045 [Bacteroidetes bacterium GWE2_42_39]OFY44911.1 MAG: hypothetical protein A2W90_11525 [Bacteroidetes bacterium GWF2_42_66]HBL76039.1 YihY/virulence factor BrkB family protein [Prolixibacteraceae bacterium]HCR89664.1 YihY/virulence factor BrkB family protein [Prolixibacteraceae bacterium]